MASSACIMISKLTNQVYKVVHMNNVLLRPISTSSTPLMAKHWNQKYRKLRSQKVVKVDIPDYEESQAEMTKEFMRSKMKEKGVLPSHMHVEKPFNLCSTGDIFEPYIPPEGDGKISFITKEGAKQKLDFVGKKGKSMLAIRKLRKFDDDFEVDDFLVTAQDVYMKAHNAMMNVRKDQEELLVHVTESAYPQMLHNALDKTIHWQMIGLLEPLRLVQARTVDVITKENLFCQLTVRFHTQQKLAVYDRFGRLMYGSEILAKDVLEYIVFERHLANRYSNWRLHAKIIPDWLPPKEPVPKTYRVVEEEPPPPTPSNQSLQQTTQLPPSEGPALATA